MAEGGERERATTLGLSVDSGAQGPHYPEVPQIQVSTWEREDRVRANVVGGHTQLFRHRMGLPGDGGHSSERDGDRRGAQPSTQASLEVKVPE